MCLNCGIPKNNFPCGTNGKLIILGVPKLKHITVFLASVLIWCTMDVLAHAGGSVSSVYIHGKGIYYMHNKEI